MPIMKSLYLSLIGLFLVSCTPVDQEQYDTRAIDSLDSMSEAIGALNSTSYTLDQVSAGADGTEVYIQHDVYMRGPNKMYIHSNGSKGKSSIWYDGETLTRFKFNDNSYATVEVSGDIIQTIDYVNEKYGVDFPAADFFFPDFTDNIISQFDHVLFIGDEDVDGTETTSVVASNTANTMQLWINKTSNLPLKLLIDSKESETEFYQITFSNFRVNPNLPDTMFEFSPPVDLEKTEF